MSTLPIYEIIQQYYFTVKCSFVPTRLYLGNIEWSELYSASIKVNVAGRSVFMSEPPILMGMEIVIEPIESHLYIG